ncbi:hypothetical protein CL614_09265 [archaeon]|jgi:hypothetical protein|nr:hypothetical protein [archaeon]|tara:strand:- start:927 stop:1406 length:480 start_codon:yes stop_codon:yes gene_type:complete
MSKNLYKSGFDFLTSYLDFKYNIKVIQKHNGEEAWYPNLKTIIINKNYQWRDRLIALIHESGHVQIDLEQNVRKNLRCANNKVYNYPTHIKSKSALVNQLNEELMAWNLGKKLALSLNIKFDIKRLDETSTKCIMSYIKEGLKEVYGKTINVAQIDPGI